MKRTRGYALFCELFPGADVSADELEFLKAMDRYQRLYRRRYPTWREVLFVARCLGYRKVAAAVPLPEPGSADAPPAYPVPGDEPAEPLPADGESVGDGG